MKRQIDFSLYLIVDPDFCKAFTPEETVVSSIQGGVSMVQLRCKDASTSEFCSLAKKIKLLTDAKSIPLIINDRVDVAKAVDASGVHLGTEDLSPQVAREILGSDAILGFSVPSSKWVRVANDLPIDYCGVGPIFSTSTKACAEEPLGLSEFKNICAGLKHPVVGIGGIGSENAMQVIRAGAKGIAVVSAICSAANPELASQEFCGRIRSGAI
jgi:thiamine-phosphate pyrophosphorylase